MTQFVSKEALEKMVTLQKGYIDKKQDAFTVGTGLSLSSDNVLSITLDHTVYKVVDELPTAPASGDENKIHLVPSSSTGTNNSYIEYIYVDGAWEQLGEYSAEVDLSPYLRTANLTASATTSSGTLSLLKNGSVFHKLVFGTSSFAINGGTTGFGVDLKSMLTAAVTSGFYKFAADTKGRITATTAVAASDITALGFYTQTEVDSKTSSLQTAINSHDDEIITLQRENESRQSEITALDQRITTNTTNIATNTTDIATNASDIAALQTSLAAIEEFTETDATSMYHTIYGYQIVTDGSEAVS